MREDAIMLRSAHCPGNLLVRCHPEVIPGAGLETEKKAGGNGEGMGVGGKRWRDGETVEREWASSGDKTALC